MSRTYQGGIITNNPATPTGPFQCGTAPGIWTIDQMLAWQKAGVWPVAGNLKDGTTGIFALGLSPSNSITRNKFTYATCVSTSATSATQASGFGAAVGNCTKGIFALGFISGNNTASRDKYTYSGDTVASAAAASRVNNSGAAAGNSTVGIFALASNCYGCFYTCYVTSTTNKYTYSSCVNAVATGLCAPTRGTFATGNNTFGVFQIGTTGGCGSYFTTTLRRKYIYSGCVLTSATASGTNNSCGAAVGNNTVGIFTQCGSGRQKYTYSGCTVSSATSASRSSSQGSAVGNSTRGIFAIGSCTTTRNKYVYSGDVNTVVGSCGVASAASRGGSAAGNGTTGVNI